MDKIKYKKIGLSFVKYVVSIVFGTCIVATIAYAGSLIPPSSPSATMYTLDDIYARLTTNAIAGSHTLSTTTAPMGSFHTLAQIYNAIPTVYPTDLLASSTYLGVTGSIVVKTGDNVVSTSATTTQKLLLTPPIGYYNGIATVSTTSVNFIAGNIANGVNIFGVVGTLASLDTSDATAGTGDILSPYTAYVNGSKITGTIFSASGNTAAASSSPQGTSIFITVPQGYYSGAASVTVSTSSPNFAAGNIATGTPVFGVVGTLLGNMWDGTGQGFTGGSQANGGVDDYNNGSSPTSGRYAGTWTQCVSGNSYCGTGDSGAAYKDNSTGVIWSQPCNGTGCSSLAAASPGTYSWDNSGGSNGSVTASVLCSGHSGWSLPSQKQLMQAYIDGSYGNLEASGVFRYYWSATTVSANTTVAWYVNLSDGFTYFYTKTTAYYVRCVR